MVLKFPHVSPDSSVSPLLPSCLLWTNSHGFSQHPSNLGPSDILFLTPTTKGLHWEEKCGPGEAQGPGLLPPWHKWRIQAGVVPPAHGYLKPNVSNTRLTVVPQT